MPLLQGIQLRNDAYTALICMRFK